MKKSIWKTKTFRAGLAMVLTGLGLILADKWSEAIPLIGMGVLAMTGRHAITKMEQSR